MHYGLTKKLSHKYGFSDKVFLGALMPDMLKISKLQTKYESHYMDEEGLPDIEKYIEEKMKNGYTEEEFGYFLHLVQDRIWYSRMLKIREDWRDCKDALYSDMNICDRFVLKSLDMDKDDFLKAKKKIYDLAEGSIVKDCINDSFIIRDIKNKDITFISKEIFDEYMENAYKECEKYIDNLGSICYKKISI